MNKSLALLLFAASSFPLCATNLVANSGFETGDFTAWTLYGHDSQPGFEGIDYGVDSSDAYSGAYGAYLGGFGNPLYLTQALATTPGTDYSISFWLAQSPTPVTPYENTFTASFGSNSLVSLTQVPNTAFSQFTFISAADLSFTPLTFGFRDDLGFFSIDDISVTPLAVPEPAAISLPLLGGLLLLFVSQGRNRN